MHADRHAARAGVDVIAAERALSADIKLTVGIKR